MNTNSIANTRLAIRGMAISLPGCADLGSFQHLLYRGERVAGGSNESRDEGLLQEIVRASITDAGALEENLAVILVENHPVPPGFSGLVIHLPAGSNWLLSAVHQAALLLERQDAHAVIIAAGDSAQGGAAAVVFQSYDAATASEQRVYAVLDAQPKTAISAGSLELGSRVPGKLSRIQPEDFLHLISTSLTETQCALGSVAETLSFNGELADLAGLIKLGLSLHRRTHYAVPNWQGPVDESAWSKTPFYVPAESRPWFVDTGYELRQAVWVCPNAAGGLAGLALTEEPALRFPAQVDFCPAGMHLLPMQAGSQAALLDRLDQLFDSLDQGESLICLAGQTVSAYLSEEPKQYALGLAADSLFGLRQEIEHARRGIVRAFEMGTEWQSPAGSAFSARPLGEQGGLAFVYPGAFNSHLGLACDLFALFPWLQDRLTDLTETPELSMRAEQLYPSRVMPLQEEDLEDLEASLVRDPIAMLTSGTAAAFLYTTVLQEVFGLQPSHAFGYSLGENSMLFSLGVWQAADEARCNLAESPLFHTHLAGPQHAARQYWGWPLADEQLALPPVWGNFVLMASADQVMAALDDEPHVYLTHINAPRQVVIGGEAAACQRVIASLKCMSLQAPYDYALHCAAMASEYQRLEALHTLPVESIPQAVLYTAAGYDPVILDSALIAENIATALTNQLDFPRLVERVYADGARIFIEVGAGSNCSKWIDAILKGRPHTAVWVDQAKVDEQTMLVRLLAKLVSQRVPVDLSMLQRSQPAGMAVPCW